MNLPRLLAVLAAPLLAAAALAQPYPNHPVRLVVPFPPGGGFDGIARPFAERLSAALGQPVVVDNRAGAGGNIGTESVARSPADGYTLLFANDYLGTNPNLYKGLKYDPLRDFAPISLVGSTQMAIAVNPAKVRATDAQSLLAESQQRTLQYGTPGVGTSPHLFGELYAFNTGTRVQHVPYRGTGPAVTDAIGGQIDFALVTVPALVQHVKAGKLRAITVIGGTTRSPLLPEVPTLAENGVRGVDHDVWYGLFAPAGTPPEVLKRLREATAAVLAQPELAERLRQLGYDLTPSTPEALSERVKTDLAKWKQVVERAKITLE
ncbi:tripartite tricarboxylate transporter substrate binding protein [Variovorax terrae]|uniref:Tripartite tricarboxylate transporter substrate binding protein n=1 Tax=Variovorax terrae TaxID=2923278 RepID=A0A9X2ALC5_9BURK|nr:tripartite tricarboxylate transporter substrate binding protein [Variovorax terrae]MCJ0762169.1 tripartite tricarboxylate transporter substrate binding protein [Variovorax terrae]